VRGVLLIDHGSRNPRANEVVLDAANKMRDALPGTLVEHAHLEIASPTITEGVEALLERGATELFVQPWFLAPGRHVETDVPGAVRAALGARSIPVSFGVPFGADDALVALVLTRLG
jgi:sirohydrochlorin ferrochelatase